MKKMAMLIFLLNSFNSFAETEIYDDGIQLKAILLSENESKELYRGLKIYQQKGRSGSSRSKSGG